MRRAIHVSCAALLTALLSACGGGGGDSTAPGSETPSATGQQSGASVRSRAVIASASGSGSGSGAAVSNMLLIAQVPTVDVKVKSLIKASESRVSRTVFDYVFRVELVNAGAALTNVKGSITAAGDGTTIVDGSVVVGDMAAGQTTTPSDTITLRHDRTKAFDSSALVWAFTSETGGGPTVPGILLPGNPSDLAVDAVPEIDSPRTASDLATALGAGGQTRYYLKQLQAVISSSATVGQVNAALLAVGGRIAWAMERNRVVTIQVPNDGDLQALSAIAAALESSPAFNNVSLYVLPVSAALPANVSAQQAVLATGPILNQIGARLPAVWNLSNIDTSHANLEVVVADFFGNGAVTQTSGPVAGILPPSPQYSANQHGYHVLGTLAANFGGTADGIGPVTGSLMLSLPINVIDMADYSGVFWEALRNRVGALVKAKPDTRYVMNFSLQYCQTPNPTTKLCVAADLPKKDAEAWRTWARGIYLPAKKTYFKWDEKVLTVAAAGNHAGAMAETASPINAAGLLPTIISKGDNTTVPPIHNTIVVEARVMSTPATGPVAGCRDASYSNKGGTVAGIGTKVFSFTSPTTVGFMDGTSMATPQVAGIAALMGAIRPSMSLSDIKYRIEHVRFTTDACGDAPMVDAYAAVLSLDASMADAPVRKSLMKASVASPGPQASQLVGYADVLPFLQHYFPQAYQITPETQPAFSRFDLNSDGRDGEVSKVLPFDMEFDNANKEFVPTKVDKYSSIGNPAIKLDEASASDFQILCYYINSPLFDVTQKPLVDAELARLSLPAVLNRKISCSDPTVFLEVKDLSLGWTGLPASMTLKNFVTPFPATFAGNSSTCTNQGAAAGERGLPLFSASVPSPVQILAAIDVAGVPTPLNGGAINRRNCSSFFAQAPPQVWINATGRAVFGFGGVAVSDWEYQVRYTNGLKGVGQRCSVGVVPNSNFFSTSFEATQCSHEVTAVIAE